MVDPYTSSLKGKAFYVEKEPVYGAMVGVLGGFVENRHLQLIPQRARALLNGQIHELILTREANAENPGVIDEVSYLGFFMVDRGGMVVAGDEMVVGGQSIGMVLGFDETHMPNHLNIVVQVSDRRDGKDLGVRCGDVVRFGDRPSQPQVTVPWGAVSTSSIQLKRGVAVGVRVGLPKTAAMVISAKNGYLMCGVLDVANLDLKLPDRRVVAARVTGVRSFDDMLEAKIELATAAARDLGVVEGFTTGRQALELMF